MIDGVLNVLKPPKMTSHDVVSVVRRALGTKKVGHTGTLDPMAAGVLPICVERATKIVDFLQNDQKKYRAELTLGKTTDTEDCWGETLTETEVNLEPSQIEKAVLSFIGEIDQVPPMYSALKVNGKKLYELAREGKVIERKSRKRTIFSIDIIEINNEKIRFDVVCSKGTYIRTLCYDIGEKLGVGGHMSFLLRLESGRFSLNDTLTIEELQELDTNDIVSKMMPIDEALGFSKRININSRACELIKNGVKTDLIRNAEEHLSDQDYVLVYHDDKFIALSQYNEGKLLVTKLFDISR